MAIGQTIALACNDNSTKINGSNNDLPALQVIIKGYNKQDPLTKKMLPVEANVPALLVKIGYGKSSSHHTKAIGDLAMIVFYYLLCIGKYTVKRKCNNTKQTVQFKLKDIQFFKRSKMGILACLPRMAPASMIMSANSATLKLDNQKNRWKGVCTPEGKWGNIQLSRS
jgi:hypothetical protein